MPISTLFFDLDGTVSDNSVGITRCLNYSFERLGHNTLTPAQVLPLIGPPFRESLPKLVPGIDVERALQLYRERYDTEGWLENHLYDGITDTIKTLHHRGYTIALCTSKPRVAAQRIITHFGLSPYFSGVHGPELGGRFDKKNELLSHLMQHYQLAPPQAVMIGDRDKDIQAARHVGSHSIGVLWGFGDQTELHRAGADRMIEHPQNLLDAIEALH